MELGIFVQDRFIRVGWIKGPSVHPAHVEGAFSAVKVAPKRVFLGVVGRVLPVFPYGRKGLKLEGCDLGVGASVLSRRI